MDKTNNGQCIEIEVYGKERAELLLPSLLQLRVHCITHIGNMVRGEGPALTLKIRPEDDKKLLHLWDEITDLRMRYLAARQAERVVQLSYLEGSEEVVVL